MQADGIVGAGVLSVPPLGYGAVIIITTLGSTGVPTLGGSGSSTLRDGNIYIPALEVHQVYSGGIEPGLQVVLGLLTGFQ